MHKTTRRTTPSSQPFSSSPGKRVLQLSMETIRTLSSAELSHAISGCPLTSTPTTLADGTDSSAC